MEQLDLGFLGASKVGASGAAVVQISIGVQDETSDLETFGECPMFQGLGLTSFPYPKDDNGYAECLFARNVGSHNAVLIGARDTRTAKIVGNGKPGDTVVHSTDPSQSAQLQLKGSKRQAALLTEDSSGQTQLVLLDGNAKKLQIYANGSIFEMSGGGISMFDSTGKAGITLKDGKVNILGNVVFGNGQNPMSLMVGPPIGSPGGTASAALQAVKGITVAL